MRGGTYYALVDTVKLYSSPSLGTPVATINRLDEAGVSTGNVVVTNGDRFIELVRLSDSKKLYALEKEVSLNPEYDGNTLPTVNTTTKRTNPDGFITTQIKQRPVVAYGTLGLLLIGIGTLVAKLN